MHALTVENCVQQLFVRAAEKRLNNQYSRSHLSFVRAKRGIHRLARFHHLRTPTRTTPAHKWSANLMHDLEGGGRGRQRRQRRILQMAQLLLIHDSQLGRKLCGWSMLAGVFRAPLSSRFLSLHHHLRCTHNRNQHRTTTLHGNVNTNAMHRQRRCWSLSGSLPFSLARLIAQIRRSHSPPHSAHM